MSQPNYFDLYDPASGERVELVPAASHPPRPTAGARRAADLQRREWEIALDLEGYDDEDRIALVAAGKARLQKVIDGTDPVAVIRAARDATVVPDLIDQLKLALDMIPLDRSAPQMRAIESAILRAGGSLA